MEPPQESPLLCLATSAKFFFLSLVCQVLFLISDPRARECANDQPRGARFDARRRRPARAATARGGGEKYARAFRRLAR